MSIKGSVKIPARLANPVPKNNASELTGMCFSSIAGWDVKPILNSERDC